MYDEAPERAKQIVAIGRRQTELPVTFGAFAEGRLSVDQVAVVAKRTSVHNDREACALAQAATVAQLRVGCRTVSNPLELRERSGNNLAGHPIQIAPRVALGPACGLLSSLL